MLIYFLMITIDKTRSVQNFLHIGFSVLDFPFN